MNEELNEQQIIRREKLTKLRTVEYPYPNDVKITADSEKINELVKIATSENLTELQQTEKLEALKTQTFTLAGRLMSQRLMGKAAFSNLQDQTGQIQFYIRKDDVGDEIFATYKNLDIGDIIEISGYPFRTKTGESSLHLQKIRLLAKCLNPLPEKWHGLTDKELRYRQRYVDLIVNPEVREVFVKRSQIIQYIRTFFFEHGYLEAETPFLSAIASGANARPFETHHNALDLNLHLRISPELYLKRLITGGFNRVFDMGKMFRNEGIDLKHNPEFTMIEFYQAYATYEDLMHLTEDLIGQICDKIIGSRQIEYDGKIIDWTAPWERLNMVEAIYKYLNIPKSIDLYTLAGVKQAAKLVGFDGVEHEENYGLAMYELFDSQVESKIINPTFITRHPLEISPLSRPALDDPRFVDRFELFVNGTELANAFNELNDPEDQEQRFLKQAEAKAAGDEEAMEYDADFVNALSYGMPPTAGEGIGIDRLVMLLTGNTSIRDVMLFPLMRP
ncbi:MAG: lysine--tRNA ligase [Deltaproteobacteria bacterium]|jgi:lysyl-tRNA synthetase class 2|nr:lysine--tRNA ligase [Deltaproteobacteria bacterium]